MSALINQYFKRSQLETMLKAADEKGLSITSAINDETNEYGQNISSWITQSKEDREAKVKRTYVSNGSVVHTDNGMIVKAAKTDKIPF